MVLLNVVKLKEGWCDMGRGTGNLKRPVMPVVQKPVGPARPVGALKPIGGGGMAKMPTTGGAARRPDMSRVQKPMMKKGGVVKKTAAKKGKK